MAAIAKVLDLVGLGTSGTGDEDDGVEKVVDRINSSTQMCLPHDQKISS
jgi:hypothetical protein